MWHGYSAAATVQHMDVKGKDEKYLGRDSGPDLQIVRSEGSTVVDAKGRKYIDFTSGWCVGNLGWGNEEVLDRVRRFEGPAYVDPSFLYRPWAELAELLAKITPGKLQKCFRATGGTEAVEFALQAAMVHTGRRKFMSLESSYHGNSIGTLSIGSSSNRERFENLLPNCYKLEPPLDEKALRKVETRLKRRDVAAFIMEPISIAHGVLVPAPEFMVGLQRLCRRYGTLLVMDEVACGFGRTGTLFASEHFAIEPDILCLGKAISGGYGALGATIMTAKVAKSMERDGSFYSTFGWHPIAVAAAIASIRYVTRHRKRLLDGVAALSEYFRARLSSMEFGFAPEIRIRGLAIALEFEDPGYASSFQDECHEKGLLLTNADEAVVLLLPPMTLDRETARRGLDIMEACA